MREEHNLSGAARRAKVSRPTARKAYVEGYPEKGWPPIREVLARDEAEARAALVLADRMGVSNPEVPGPDPNPEGKETVGELAKYDMVASRARETVLVRAARENVIGYQQATNKLLHAQIKLAGMVQREVEELEKSGQRPSLKDGVRLMATVGAAVRQGHEAAILSMRMERLLLGEPEAVLGLTDLTADECVSEIRKAERALERAAERGLICIDGGRRTKRPPRRTQPPMVTLEATGTEGDQGGTRVAVTERQGAPLGVPGDDLDE